MITIAVIGGGVVGVGLLKSLSDYKYNTFLFEKNNELGGIWSSNKYIDLKIQSNSRHYRYIDKVHKKNIYRMNGNNIKKYVQDYIKDNNLENFINLNFDVKIIKGINKHILINKKNNKRFHILFDYVIYTGQNTNKNIPQIFKNLDNIIYPDMLSKDLINDINNKTNKKVVIYGGSKSAMDMAYTLKTKTKADILLISRGFNTFTRSSKKNSIPYSDIITAVYHHILNYLGFNNKTFINSLHRYNIYPESGSNKKNGDNLTIDEYNVIKKINKKINTIIKISKNEITLNDNKKIKYDYIILCLGYIPTYNELKCKTIISYDSYLTFIPPPLALFNTHINSFLINEYIKYNHDDFDLFSTKRIKELSIYGVLYQTLYLLTPYKLLPFYKFILITRTLLLIIPIYIIIKLYKKI